MSEWCLLTSHKWETLNWLLSAFKIEGGPWAKECRQLLEARKPQNRTSVLLNFKIMCFWFFKQILTLIRILNYLFSQLHRYFHKPRKIELLSIVHFLMVNMFWRVFIKKWSGAGWNSSHKVSVTIYIHNKFRSKLLENLYCLIP